MIEQYSEYEDFVKHITLTVPLIKTEQLKLMISKYFSQDINTVDTVLLALQGNQVILTTQDGWSMTPGQYIKLTGDRFLTARNSWTNETDELRRLPNMDEKCRKVNKSLSKCLWIVADMMPDSSGFILTGPPFSVAFTTVPTEKRPSYVYEVAYIDRGYEVVGAELLRRIPKTGSNHVKKSIIRICVIEDEDYAFEVPWIGFAYIVKIDHSRLNHYRVVEERTARKGISLEERWKDDPFHE